MDVLQLPLTETWVALLSIALHAHVPVFQDCQNDYEEVNIMFAFEIDNK